MHFSNAVICKMSIDKFGRFHSKNIKIIKGSPGIGFQYTADGNFDITNKRLTNVLPPVKDSDAVTNGFLKTYKNKIVEEVEIVTRANLLALKNEILGDVKKLMINQTEEGHYNFNNKRILNVASPKNDNDVATRKFIIDEMQKLHRKIEEIENKLAKASIILRRTVELEGDLAKLKDIVDRNGR